MMELWTDCFPMVELCRRSLQIGIGLALQSTLLLGLALLIGHPLRRTGPALRSLFYRVMLAVIVVSGLASSVVGRHLQPLWSVSLPAPLHPPIQSITPLEPAGVLPGPEALSPDFAVTDPLGLWRKAPPAGARDARERMVGDAARGARATGSLAAGESRTSASRNPAPWPASACLVAVYVLLAGLWGTGALFLLFRLLVCQFQLLRLRRRAVPLRERAVQTVLMDLCRSLQVRPPLLLAGPGVQSPFLTGLWRPAIWLPADYDRQFDGPTLRIILTHELVHLARRDCAWNLLAWLVCALGWAQPLLWVVRRRLVETSEEVSDAEVVRLEGNPRDYASCLLTLSERLLPSTSELTLGVGVAPFRSSLGRRIQQILDSHRQGARPLSTGHRSAVVVGASALAALGLALVSAVAAPPAGRPSTDISGLPTEHASGNEPQRSVLAGVPALDQPVTLSETKIPLGELVQKVAAETGVPLVAAPNAADEPVLAVVKDLPARELLQQLADLLDYLWVRRGKAGAWRYEIWQDVAGRQREQLLREAALNEVEQRLREQLSRFVTLASLPPAEIQRQAQEYERQRQAFFNLPPPQRMLVAPKVRPQLDQGWIAQRLASPVNRVLAQFLARLSPEQWTALRSGRPLRFASDPEPGEQPLPEAMVRRFRAARPNMDTGWGIGDPEMAEKQRQLQRDREAQWQVAKGYRVKIRLDGTRFREMGLLSLQASASATPASGVAGEPDRLGWGEPEGTSIQLSAEPNAPYPMEPEETPERNAALERDPILGARKTVMMAMKPGTAPGDRSKSWWTVREMPEAIARTYGVSVIADAYEANQVNVPRPGKEPIALYLLLDRFAAPFYRWDHQGHLIRLRNREWFFDRPREVPLRLVRRWRELYDRYGGLPLEETLAAVATLNDAQLQSADDLLQRSIIPAHQVFPQPLYPTRHALRLYAALTPGQQQALWSGRALGVAEMTPSQRGLFLAALLESERARQPDAGEPASSPGALLSPDAAFTLVHQRLIRVIQSGADSTTVTSEPAPEAEPARPSALAAAAPPSTARRHQAVTRDAMTDLTFELVSGPERREEVHVTVASPR